MSFKKTALQKGIIDPVTIIGVLFFVITLGIGTYVASNSDLSFNINEKAADKQCNICLKTAEDKSLCDDLCVDVPVDTKTLDPGECGYCVNAKCIACRLAGQKDLGACASSNDCAVSTSGGGSSDTTTGGETCRDVNNNVVPNNTVVVYGDGTYRKCIDGIYVNNCSTSATSTRICTLQDVSIGYVPTYLADQYNQAIYHQELDVCGEAQLDAGCGVGGCASNEYCVVKQYSDCTTGVINTPANNSKCQATTVVATPSPQIICDSDGGTWDAVKKSCSYPNTTNSIAGNEIQNVINARPAGTKRCSSDKTLETWDGKNWNAEDCDYKCSVNKCIPKPVETKAPVTIDTSSISLSENVRDQKFEQEIAINEARIKAEQEAQLAREKAEQALRDQEKQILKTQAELAAQKAKEEQLKLEKEQTQNNGALANAKIAESGATQTQPNRTCPSGTTQVGISCIKNNEVSPIKEFSSQAECEDAAKSYNDIRLCPQYKNEEEKKTTLLSGLINTLSEKFDTAVSSSNMEGFGTTGLGGGNAYIAPVPMNIITSKNREDIYRYAGGNFASFGTGAVTATVITGGVALAPYVPQVATTIVRTVSSTPQTLINLGLKTLANPVVQKVLPGLLALDAAESVVSGATCAASSDPNSPACITAVNSIMAPPGATVMDDVMDFVGSLRPVANFADNILGGLGDGMGSWPTGYIDNSITAAGSVTQNVNATNLLNNTIPETLTPSTSDMLFAPNVNEPITPTYILDEGLGAINATVHVSYSDGLTTEALDLKALGWEVTSNSNLTTTANVVNYPTYELPETRVAQFDDYFQPIMERPFDINNRTPYQDTYNLTLNNQKPNITELEQAALLDRTDVEQVDPLRGQIGHNEPIPAADSSNYQDMVDNSMARKENETLFEWMDRLNSQNANTKIAGGTKDNGILNAINDVADNVQVSIANAVDNILPTKKPDITLMPIDEIHPHENGVVWAEVDKLSEIVEQGYHLDPIKVTVYEGRVYSLDGANRAVAYLNAGQSNIPIEYLPFEEAKTLYPDGTNIIEFVNDNNFAKKINLPDRYTIEMPEQLLSPADRTVDKVEPIRPNQTRIDPSSSKTITAQQILNGELDQPTSIQIPFDVATQVIKNTSNSLSPVMYSIAGVGAVAITTDQILEQFGIDLFNEEDVISLLNPVNNKNTIGTSLSTNRLSIDTIKKLNNLAKNFELDLNNNIALTNIGSFIQGDRQSSIQSSVLKDNSYNYSLTIDEESLKMIQQLPDNQVITSNTTITFTSSSNGDKIQVNFPYGNGQITAKDIKNVYSIISDLGGLARFLPSLDIVKIPNLSNPYITDVKGTNESGRLTTQISIDSDNFDINSLRKAIVSTLGDGEIGNSKVSELKLAFYNTFYIGRVGSPGNYSSIATANNTNDIDNDLATTMTMYFNNPDLLKQTDPYRFAFIDAVYKGYSPESIVLADTNGYFDNELLTTTEIIREVETNSDQYIYDLEWEDIPEDVAKMNFGYKSLVEEMSEKYNVPVAIIVGVMQRESGAYDNRESIVSNDGYGSVGLMQIIPGPGRGSANDLKDPRTNIEIGTQILLQIYNDPSLGNGNWKDSVALYNTGDWDTLLNQNIISEGGYIYADKVFEFGGIE